MTAHTVTKNVPEKPIYFPIGSLTTKTISVIYDRLHCGKPSPCILHLQNDKVTRLVVELRSSTQSNNTKA